MPLQIVERVSKFKIKNEDYKKKDAHLYSFMFEVVLMQDYEDVFFFRDFEVNYGSGGSRDNSPARSKSRSNSPRRKGIDRSLSPHNLPTGVKRTNFDKSISVQSKGNN